MPDSPKPPEGQSKPGDLAPSPEGIPRRDFKGILERAVSEGVTPGAVLLAGSLTEPGRVLTLSVGNLGRTRERVPTTLDALYDLASLTKVASTTALCLRALSMGPPPGYSGAGPFGLDSKLSSHFPDSPPDLSGISLRDLLSHQSGLPAWKPLYLNPPDIPYPERAKAVRLSILRERPLFKPGEGTLYSDLGFMLLGFILEQAFQESLPSLYRALLQEPLGLGPSCFSPRLCTVRPKTLPDIAPTEDGLRVGGPLDSKEARVLGAVPLGECHDDNARYLLGAAGHAGLFSSVSDLYATMRLFSSALAGESPLITQDLMREFLAPKKANNGSSRPLGFDILPLRKGSLRGHLGYTGATLWWSTDLDRVLILLANRVHPSSREQRMPKLRAALVECAFPELT
ncbi:MAG: beta-lactamase family protein [Deltaproteobacteria bacterium]|jgi:CubicO group peptidase (beta-lactamase class C family)|nr:beta-lactamase family protein [Deltaproteobacteria bacterium]